MQSSDPGYLTIFIYSIIIITTSSSYWSRNKIYRQKAPEIFLQISSL